MKEPLVVALTALFSSAYVGGCVSATSDNLVVDEGIVVMGDDAHAALAEEVAHHTREDCGATFSLVVGNRQASGIYVVSVYPEPTRGKILATFPAAADVLAFIDANQDLLDQPLHTLGTYCEGAGGGDCRQGMSPTCYLDISLEATALSDAARLARACNQRSVALLAKDGGQIIEQEGGKPFGSGQGLTGAALAPCVAARTAPP